MLLPSTCGHYITSWDGSIRHLLAWLWTSWINYVDVQYFSRSVTIPSSASLQMVSWYSFSSFVESPFMCLYTFAYKLKNSNGTTVRTFSNFNLLRGRCMFLPFPSALTSLCTPAIVYHKPAWKWLQLLYLTVWLFLWIPRGVTEHILCVECTGFAEDKAL